jgi:hypothetical protein
MNNYIPEEYSKAIELLEPLIEKYGLDSVMISSIVRGSIEKEERPIQPASKVWKSKDGKVYTVKPANIKINLSFALANAFRLKTIFSQKDIWLVLAIIYLIVDMFTNAVKKVDEMSALVLLSTFRLQAAEKREIIEYAKKILPQESELDISDDKVQNALDILEELKCIKLEDGKYSVIETIGSSLYSYG